VSGPAIRVKRACRTRAGRTGFAKTTRRKLSAEPQISRCARGTLPGADADRLPVGEPSRSRSRGYGASLAADRVAGRLRVVGGACRARGRGDSPPAGRVSQRAAALLRVASAAPSTLELCESERKVVGLTRGRAHELVIVAGRARPASPLAALLRRRGLQPAPCSESRARSGRRWRPPLRPPHLHTPPLLRPTGHANHRRSPLGGAATDCSSTSAATAEQARHLELRTARQRERGSTPTAMPGAET